MVESNQQQPNNNNANGKPPQQRPPLRKPVFIAMSQLEPGTRVNMHLRVHSVRVIRERRRYDGGSLNRVAECIVGD